MSGCLETDIYRCQERESCAPMEDLEAHPTHRQEAKPACPVAACAVCTFSDSNNQKERESCFGSHHDHLKKSYVFCAHGVIPLVEIERLSRGWMMMLFFEIDGGINPHRLFHSSKVAWRLCSYNKWIITGDTRKGNTMKIQENRQLEREKARATKSNKR